MICLCLAISSLGRAMQRQSDNRHHLIAQVRSSDLLSIFISNLFLFAGDGISVSLPENPKAGWRSCPSRNRVQLRKGFPTAR